MKIEILGSGCAKCQKLADNARTAVAGTETTVEKVEDMNVILGYGVMITPALVVDGVVKVSGRVPSVDEIRRMVAK